MEGLCNPVGHAGGVTNDDALASAADQLGDRWTLRALSVLGRGPATFGELETALGVATNVLSSRLKRLEADGIVVAEPYQDRPTRFRYALTERGAAAEDVLRLLAEWGASGDSDDEGPTHDACGTPLELVWSCPTCGQIVDRDHVHQIHL